MTLEDLRENFAKDRFATGAGIAIDSAEPGRAVCSLRLGPQHLNAAGMAQGGLIFTLADFCFAVAAHRQGSITVTLNCTINYLAVPKGDCLVATATHLGGGYKAPVYRVEVRDCEENLAAVATVTGYVKPLKTD